MEPTTPRLLVARSVERRRHSSGWRQTLIVSALAVGAAVMLTLGVQAAGSHTVRTKTQTPSGQQPVDVSSNPTASAQTIALVTVGIGALSAFAALGSLAVSVLAIKGPRPN